MRKKKVVIIGGGVAGLTAAHELIERGFDVHVYERRARWGGKAASVSTHRGFSGEHGFRFFPGWYRHLPDTMARIPYKTTVVSDNLVIASQNLFASYRRDPVSAPLRIPSSFSELLRLAAVPESVLRLGLTAADFIFFFGKLAEFAAATEEERMERYETETWWSFMEADRRSDEFRAYLVAGVTRNTVAADPRQANAYTIATVALRTLTDAARLDSPVDRVLNGPTSKVWIDPWCEHLRARGVVLHGDAELESIEFSEGSEIKGVMLRCGGLEVRCCDARWRLLEAYYRLEKAHGESERTRLSEARRSQLEAELESEDHWEALRFAGALAQGEEDVAGWCDAEGLRQLSLEEASAQAAAARRRLQAAIERSEEQYQLVEADYFVFALPIEQMAYQVKRSPTLRRHDPSLVNLMVLAGHVEWMSGIQFYLTEEIEITRGHIDCLDSEWALTAICQSQFWTEEDVTKQGTGELHGKVKTILSVDISAWNAVGEKHRKEAFRCTPREIAEEVWYQLGRSLNRPNSVPVLKDDYLLGFVEQGQVPDESFFLDDDIIGRFDRKKRGLYRAFESVRFSSEAVAERAERERTNPTTVFVHGDRMRVNVEALFVNRANTWRLRPAAATKIRNMFIAADYVKTNTNLATMEAANEAARAVVNEILAISGSRQEPCRIWTHKAPADAVLSLARLFGFDTAAAQQGAIASGEIIAHAAARAGQASRGIAQVLGNMFRRR